MEPDYDSFCEGDAAEDAGDYARARACFEQGTRLGGHLCWARLGHLFDQGRGAPLDKARAGLLAQGVATGRCDRRPQHRTDLSGARRPARDGPLAL
jgi:hypothetical protein